MQTKNLMINEEILDELKEASRLLCSFLDYDSLIEGDITAGGKIEKPLNEAIYMIENGGFRNEHNKSPLQTRG